MISGCRYQREIPTWNCGSVPGRCHPPCRSRMLHVPWPYKVCMLPMPWPWPPHHVAKRTVPFFAVSLGPPTPSAHEREMGSGWFLGHPNQYPLPLLVYVLSSAGLCGWACHPGWEPKQVSRWKEKINSFVFSYLLVWHTVTTDLRHLMNNSFTFLLF